MHCDEEATSSSSSHSHGHQPSNHPNPLHPRSQTSEKRDTPTHHNGDSFGTPLVPLYTTTTSKAHPPNSADSRHHPRHVMGKQDTNQNFRSGSSSKHVTLDMAESKVFYNHPERAKHGKRYPRSTKDHRRERVKELFGNCLRRAFWNVLKPSMCLCTAFRICFRPPHTFGS